MVTVLFRHTSLTSLPFHTRPFCLLSEIIYFKETNNSTCAYVVKIQFTRYSLFMHTNIFYSIHKMFKLKRHIFLIANFRVQLYGKFGKLNLNLYYIIGIDPKKYIFLCIIGIETKCGKFLVFFKTTF